MQVDLLRYIFLVNILDNQYTLPFIMPITNVQVLEEDVIDPDNMTYEVRSFCPPPLFFLFVAMHP